MIMEMEKNDPQEENALSNQDEKKKKSTFFVAAVLAVAILISSIFGAVFGFMAGAFSDRLPLEKISRIFKETKEEEIKQESIRQIIQEDSAVIDVVEKNSPAVVSITISKDISIQRSQLYDPFGWYELFGQDMESFGDDGSQDDEESNKTKVGSGSGFIITKDGMIVTNKHVVSDQSAEYTVITSDGKEHLAKILAMDPINDIAIIKIEGQDYQTLNLGDSDTLRIGQTVLAIGNSLGEFSNTVSKGIVSGLGRSVTASGGGGQSEKLSNIIQTDAAINPGNSGGPLLDMSGEVIGVNVAMAQGAQSIAFSIPANQIKKVIEQVQKTGKIIYPYLGVRYVPMDSQIKKKMNVSFDYGVLVVRGETVADFAVIPGSPADKAGITENDVILEINGTKIDEKNGLGDLVAKNNVGDTVVLKVWHKGDIKEISVVLVERPQ